MPEFLPATDTCARCGQRPCLPHHDECSVCWRQTFEQARPATHPREAEAAIRRYTNRPQTVQWSFYLANGADLDQRWAGYDVELVLAPFEGGIAMCRMVLVNDPEVGPLLIIPDHPLIPFIWRREGRDIKVVLRLRIWKPENPGFLEAYWHPDNMRLEYEAKGFPASTPGAQFDEFLALLRPAPRRGRTPDATDHEAQAEYLVELRARYRELRDDLRMRGEYRRPHQYELADRMAIGVDGFVDRLKRLQLPHAWKELRTLLES